MCRPDGSSGGAAELTADAALRAAVKAACEALQGVLERLYSTFSFNLQGGLQARLVTTFPCRPINCSSSIIVLCAKNVLRIRIVVSIRCY